jgi:hypothetical protein
MQPKKREHELTRLRRLIRETTLQLEQNPSQVKKLQPKLDRLTVRHEKALEKYNKDLPKQVFAATRHAIKKRPDYSGN